MTRLGVPARPRQSSKLPPAVKTCFLTLLVAFAGTASAATTILGTTRTLHAYSSGYQYLDLLANPGGNPPVITVLPHSRTDTSDPGVGVSNLSIFSFNQYTGSGTAVACANITPGVMTVFLSSRAGNPVGGFLSR